MPTTLSDTDLLAKLVSFDSTSRNSNRPIAQWVADYLDRPGVRIEENPAPDGDKLNLVVLVGPEVEDRRAGLTLSGHFDVVPADEPEWTSDPFELVDAGDRLVARGACDMKGFDALAINTVAALDPSTLTAPLALLLTFDEEVGTLGARHFVDTWPLDQKPLPRRTLIGEPTSLRAVRLHKGHARTRLVVRGTSAHSGYPHLGHSAVEPLGRAIVALSDLGRELRAERGPNAEHFPEVPFVALNLARVRGGSAINIVPDHAELDLGFRVLPGMEAAIVRERIHQRLTEVLDGEDWSLDPIEESPPLLLDPSDDLYREVCAWVDQDETVSASYATDGGWFQTAGFDCLIWGPGDIGVAHKPDEWLPKDEFARARVGVDHLVECFCRV